MRERIVTGADGIDRYVTIEGDRVDQIAHSYYGRHLKNTEALYEANRGLSERGMLLPPGLVIVLPPIPKQETPIPFRKLYD
ncbi:tail protein X [Rhizobium sp. SSA_523]|uniref:tail protein X n=1 Tax=Rhizobium sp. SSA_523 TaxID=2952477 RepID=UPI002090DC42|nr:tail protein X [Rhizobium sp. SSA_523]MCO5730066.1 tail protein X [Rhizobium sp. SSA_523]WKC25132.1 tail protein X [Rhizobium sp. SSA_523]